MNVGCLSSSGFVPVLRQNSVRREEGMLRTDLERYTQQTQGPMLCLMVDLQVHGFLKMFCFVFLRWLVAC